MMGFSAVALRLRETGSVALELRNAWGQSRRIEAKTAILALGGRQSENWDAIELLPGVALSKWSGKLVGSDALLSTRALQQARQLLARGGALPRAVVLGGAHSAFSSVWYLLERIGAPFGYGGVRVLYRTPPRVFYPSRADAAADGYIFQEDDVCPATGRVFRMSGLRGDGREIYRRIRGLGDAPPEPRAVLRSLQDMTPQALRQELDAADLIVPAFGYRLATLPVFDCAGHRLPLATSGPVVGPDSRVLTASGKSLPNVFGIGLGSGFRPWGGMAGEPSFRGQQNSLWLYQNGLGEMIHAQCRAYGAAPDMAAA
jgi:hypothetical protein